MASKKKEEEQGASGGWINTFADLMNLLLCFFVLLFSMSTVDADKYEQLVTSMTESINIFDGGGNAVGEGAFVSSGTDQLVAISEYFNKFENTGEDTEEKEDQKTKQEGDIHQQGNLNKGEKPLQDDKKAEEAYEAKQAVKQKEMAEELYGKVMDDAQAMNIEDKININIDKNNQFVQIALNGALLFESGDDTIKDSIRPLLSRVGDILQQYKNHRIRIEGHTDNVPISGRFKNNMLLSASRANTVFEYLVKNKNIPAKSMEISGLGEYHKVASNATAKGRAQNRRVEIKIYTAK